MTKIDDRAADRLSLQADRFRLYYALIVHAMNSGEVGQAVDRLKRVDKTAEEAIREARRVLEVEVTPGGLASHREAVFLSNVFVPSVEILRAGALIQLVSMRAERDEADARLLIVGSLLADVYPRQAPRSLLSFRRRALELNHRVRYNIACFWSTAEGLGIAHEVPRDGLDVEVPIEESYAQLRDALASAPAGEQATFAKMALADGSLRTLREDDRTKLRVDLLLSGYSVTATELLSDKSHRRDPESTA